VLRKLAKGEIDARIARRILAIANAPCGMSREEAAQSLALHGSRRPEPQNISEGYLLSREPHRGTAMQSGQADLVATD
jgi:hypothetical protein